MKDTVYIVCDANGVQRMTKRQPALYRQEVAIRLAITVPDNCFRSWSFGASVEVPEDAVIQPEIEVEALEAQPVEEGAST